MLGIPVSQIANSIPSKTSLPIYYSGPPLTEGPLPAFFYFALSGKDSLELDPYNKPVIFLKEDRIRVFSFTIPGHGPGLKNNEALSFWAEGFAKGESLLTDFIEVAYENVKDLIQVNIIDESKMAVGGLSRGAFIAAHLAAKDDRFSHLLGFSPLTRLDKVKEFAGLQVSHMNIEEMIPALAKKKVRFYIGNHDSRVHTEDCFLLIHKLAHYAHANRIRNLDYELNIVPSIGHQGHGTNPETFLNGVNWLREKLL